jgi:hypothetical protein
MSPAFRELLAMPPRVTEPETDTPSEPDQPRMLPKLCPCCGGRMIIIETEHRAQSTEHRAQSTEHRAQSTEAEIRLVVGRLEFCLPDLRRPR